MSLKTSFLPRGATLIIQWEHADGSAASTSESSQLPVTIHVSVVSNKQLLRRLSLGQGQLVIRPNCMVGICRKQWCMYVRADYTTLYIQMTNQMAGWLKNKPCSFTRTSGLQHLIDELIILPTKPRSVWLICKQSLNMSTVQQKPALPFFLLCEFFTKQRSTQNAKRPSKMQRGSTPMPTPTSTTRGEFFTS